MEQIQLRDVLSMEHSTALVAADAHKLTDGHVTTGMPMASPSAAVLEPSKGKGCSSTSTTEMKDMKVSELGKRG
jgi:hypothetical protein